VIVPTPPGTPVSAVEFPFDAAVHIVTAYNPDGRELPAAENEGRDRELAESLRAHPTVRTVGSAPDGTMAEPGFAVHGLDDTAARALGRRFGQLAIYRWSFDALAIVDVATGDERTLGWRLT
jgi:Protein of unknown function (DUF3293)